jgi:UDP-2,3-diacylglucosamine hydrolase
VGDLFDFWFEYRSAVPRRYFNMLCALKKLVDQGVHIFYITGNHDFWMEKFMTDTIGVSVSQKPLEIQIEEKRFFIAHGDGLAKKDVGYRLLKKMLRNRLTVGLYRLIHPDAGYGLARYFSRLSRNHRLIKDRDEEYIAYAKNRFDEGFDCVVMGHTHRAQEYHEDGHTYINIGDWMTGFTYGTYENGRLSIERWSTELER